VLGARCGAPDDVDAHPPAAPRDEALARAGESATRNNPRSHAKRSQTNKQTKTHRFGPIRSRPRACLPIHRAIHPSLHRYAHMDRAHTRTHAHAHTSPSPDVKPGVGPSIVQGDGAEWQSRAAGTVLRCDRDSVQARIPTGNALPRSPQPGTGSGPDRERALAIAPTLNGLPRSPQLGTALALVLTGNGCRDRPNRERSSLTAHRLHTHMPTPQCRAGPVLGRAGAQRERGVLPDAARR
jgi:hypothetical protein